LRKERKVRVEVRREMRGNEVVQVTGMLTENFSISSSFYKKTLSAKIFSLISISTR